MEKHDHLGYGSAAEEPTSCFFTNSNTWDFNPMDQNDPFQSALSSMVSSPAASSGGGGGGGGENVMLRELIGRLGSICNSGEISLHSYNHIGGNTNTNTSTNTTCYSTPLNSPPKLNLTFMDHQMRGKLPFSGSHLSTKPNFISPSPSDPGFAERAARYSSYTNKDLGSLNGQIGMIDADFGQGLIPKFDGGASNSNWSLNVSGSQRDVQVEDNSIKSCFLVSDKKVRKLWKSCTPENSGFGDSMEISSLTEHVTGGQSITNGIKEANPRKRKLSTKGKAKEPSSSSKDANVVASEKTDTDAKRSKSEEDNVVEKDGTNIKEESNSSNGNKKSTGDENGNKKRPGDENGNKKNKQDKDDNSKDKVKDKVAEEEPPKDYIHVRARRGQATDAHSLAERVRREKISERMKLLQNLVPGCNLVTGKAVMLDEIINYVQSLQHQVEFLSMKLATINPRSEDLNVEAHLSKDVISHQGLLHHNNVYPSNASAPEFSLPFHPPQGPIMSGIENHYAMNNLNGSTAHNTTIQMPFSDNFGQVPSQVPAFWGNDLHTVVQMGVGQKQTQNYHGIMSTTQMKTEQ